MTRDFERDLRDWGRRPPRTRPVVAAPRVVARLQSRPGGFRFLRFAAAAVAVVALIGAGWLALRDPETTTVSAIHSQPLDDNVVLWWVDPETPVYFVLTPPNGK